MGEFKRQFFNACQPFESVEEAVAEVVLTFCPDQRFTGRFWVH